MSPSVAPSIPGESPMRRSWRPPRWAPAAGVGLLIVLIGSTTFLMRRTHEQVVPAPNVQADKNGVVLAEGAPQWDFVKLAVAEEGPALSPLPVPGRVGFDEKRTANIGSPLSGRVEQISVRLGAVVKSGDKLFSVRSRDFADLDKEEATTREAVGVKRRLRDRAKELFQLNAVSEKEVLAAEAELKEAELSMKAAQAKQRSLSVAAGGDNLFWVTAPRAGTIVALDVYASQEMTPDRAGPLIRISDMDEVLILADMLEVDATDVKVGSQALIRTRDGIERTGTVQFISTVVDPQRQTVGVRIKAINADMALKPNSFVEVTFQPDENVRRVRVDQDAVVSDGSRATIFVLEDSKRLQKQEVRPGRRRDGLVELRAGLASGARYVAKGALLLLNQVDLAD